MKILIQIDQTPEGHIGFALTCPDGPKTVLEKQYQMGLRELLVKGMDVVGKQLGASACVTTQGKPENQ